ncbi:MAG: NAD-dependent epimerase/dehydratase family protein [Acutalibacteraceae bacterium]|nr:NAD-dependent epimerase/dehydratase family protein [Acutalibacteraceae bacterium]
MLKSVEKEIENIAAADIPWDELKGSTVLVTGASGFIGTYIVCALLKRNISVLALVQSKSYAEQKLADYLGYNLKIIEHDVCDKFESDLAADYIIHCASYAAPREYSLYPVETMQINVCGTLNMLDYARRVGAKSFVYVSTIEIYGKTVGIDQIDENTYGEIDALHPRSCYPLSKKASETLCIAYAEEYGLDVKIARLSYIFGPGMSANDSKIVSVFPQCIADNKDIVLKSKGEQLRSYTYVSDAIKGIFTVLISGENKNAYNIASSLCVTSIVGIAETLVELYMDKHLNVKFELPDEGEKRAFSLIENAVMSGKKLESLGWRPTVDLKEGLKRTVTEKEELKKERLC